ncbi:hypothetical protein [Sorangium sp. So ce381]|uniref:hypothetical protein n=1 Tax=Sorangium sp. So ce381 TaxID=3133307 RepID=UPI003F5BB33C
MMPSPPTPHPELALHPELPVATHLLCLTPTRERWGMGGARPHDAERIRRALEAGLAALEHNETIKVSE